MTTDPVCKMEVIEQDSETAGDRSNYKDQEYYFCSRKCKEEFDADPEKFMEK